MSIVVDIQLDSLSNCIVDMQAHNHRNIKLWHHKQCLKCDVSAVDNMHFHMHPDKLPIGSKKIISAVYVVDFTNVLACAIYFYDIHFNNLAGGAIMLSYSYFD